MNNEAILDQSPVTKRKISDFFSKEEIKQLTAKSDLRGAWALASTWIIIFATLAATAWAAQQVWWLAAPLLVLSLIVLAGRQLCLAILMHDAAHGTLFQSKWANEVLCDWLCARPIWNDLGKYRDHHFQHHAHTNSARDTDISLSQGFPVKAASLRRKFVRDALGITGLKFYLGRLLMDMGYLKWTIAADQTPLPPIPLSQRLILLAQNFWRTALINAVLFTALWLAGHGWLFAWFWLAYTTPFPLFLRIRSMAEHACTEASNDMFKNTRTTEAGWLARMTVAPIRVNYHIEHHVMASVPYYRLPWMHQLLRAKNAVPVPPTYGQVLALMVKA